MVRTVLGSIQGECLKKIPSTEYYSKILIFISSDRFPNEFVYAKIAVCFMSLQHQIYRNVKEAIGDMMYSIYLLSIYSIRLKSRFSIFRQLQDASVIKNKCLSMGSCAQQSVIDKNRNYRKGLKTSQTNNSQCTADIVRYKSKL